MDFAFSPDQQLLKNSARAFLDEHMKPAAVRLLWGDPRGERETPWKAMAQHGWLGPSLPGASAGLRLFLCDPTAPRLRLEPTPGMDLATRLASVRLDTVPVAGDAVLGSPGQAGPLLASLLRRAALGAAAEMLGAARRCLDMAVAHAKVGAPFGQPIRSFQAIRHQCAQNLLEFRKSLPALSLAPWGPL